ncbi:MAG: PAS domain S-box protein, partial [bacterium]|nr:PAS domain S-box protein [bacterium]
KKACSLFGYTKEEILSMKKLELVSSKHRDDSYGRLQKLINGEKLDPYEKIFTKKNGDEIPVEINISIMTDDKGKPSYIQSIVRDISFRHKAEKQQKAISDISKAAISPISLDELYEKIHESLTEVIDTTNFFIAMYEESTDMITFPYFVDEQDSEVPVLIAADIDTGTSKIIKSGEPYFSTEKEMRAKIKSGDIELVGSIAKVWLGVPLKIKDEVIGVIAVQSYSDPNMFTEHDIPLLEVVADNIATAISRKKAEEQIRESEKKFRTLVENAPTGIAYADLDGNIMDINNKMVDILGAPSVEAAKKINVLDSPLLKEAGFSSGFRECIESGDIFSSEKDYRSSWGKDISVRYHLQPIKDSANIITGILMIIEDITQVRIREMEKKELEEQLLQSQKLESIGRLAGGIAHDFNNILTGIMGFAELLKMKYADVDSSEGHAASVIFSGTERAAELTKQLLGFARGGKYNPVVLSVNEVLMETIQVSEKIFEKNIEVALDLSDDAKLIEADQSQMIQVFTNLFINAKDAMPQGGELQLKTENTHIDYEYTTRYPEFEIGEYTKIMITDSGIGMTKDVKDSIFEPFFTTKGEGTGLGLATVYGIVKNHGGHIGVYSEPEIGTTFTLYFPISEKNLEIEEIIEESYPVGDATILVIDDESQVRSVAEFILKSLGYKVLLATDGKKGLKKFKDNIDEIDLVLLDMVMPNMAGKETYLEMRNIQPDVKVILASGYSQEGK